jgi:hypothetical protein
MSHVSPKIKEGYTPCEFAAMLDCVTSDGETCDTYKDPDDCEKYHRKMVLEGEETSEEFEAWKANNAWANAHRKACYSLSEQRKDVK